MIEDVPGRFPLGGTRAIIYAATARKGRLSEAVHHTLASLPDVASHVVLISAALDPDVRDRLSGVVDDFVLAPDSSSSGLPALAEFIRSHGSSMEGFDEVVLTGDSWFGPVSPLGPVVERMEDRYVDVWSITDRRMPVAGRTEGRDGAIQLGSYWLAVRPRVWQSSAWKRFWRDIETTGSHESDAHAAEAAFSRMLRDEGFRLAAAFPSEEYPAEHPDMFNVELLVADGCPAVARAVFDGYPLFYDQHAIVGRRIAAAMAARGYPVDHLWSDLAPVTAPKRLHTNGAMLEVLPDVELSPSRPPLRILSVVHVVDPEPLVDLLSRVARVPGLAHLVLTTGGRVSISRIEQAWAEAGASDAVTWEVRETPGRDTPDTAVVFDECRDLALEGGFDLVLALHTGASASLTRNAREYFRRQQYDCLVHSTGYAANVVQLFRARPSLGVVFPPTPHIGMSKLGEGWDGHEPEADRVLNELGIDVPRDWAGPLAPFGGMWWGRPEALRLLGDRSWPVGPESSAVHTRLHAYAAAELGYHARTAATGEHAGLSHGSLEYTADFMAMTSYGYPAGYTALLHRAGPVGSGRGVDFARMWVRHRHPDWWGTLSLLARIVRRLRRIARTAAGRVAKGGVR